MAKKVKVAPRVLVTAHEDFIIITTENVVEDKEFVPNGNGKIGCVLLDTEKNLGVSDEALVLLKKVPTSGDDIGDVDCFISGDKGVFSWLGGPKSLKHIDGRLTGSRTYDMSKIKFRKIPNEPPSVALEAIKRAKTQQ